MALSEQEQRLLDEIEKALIAEDKEFAKLGQAHANAGIDGSSQGNFRLSPQAAAIMLVGVCLLLGGVALAQGSLWFVALSVVGFFVMFAGGLLALRGGGPGEVPVKRRAPKGGVGAGGVSGLSGGVQGRPGSRGSRSSSEESGGGIGSEWEDKFRRRFGL